MKFSSVIYILAIGASAMIASCSGQKATYESTKLERNLIKEGNKAYADSNFVKAMQLYAEAQTAAPGSDPARFNHANALYHFGLRQEEDNRRDSISTISARALTNLADYSPDPAIREMAWYNLGNMAFRKQDYGQSIECYKGALRLNPDNQQARENLLVALIMNQQDQQDQDQNQDDQEQQQEQQEQQQQQQQQQEQQQQEQEMSANAEQILQTMQNRENQTREDTKQKAQPAPRTTDKPW